MIYNLHWTKGYDLTFSQQEEQLQTVAFEADSFSANLDFEVLEKGFEIEGEYFNISQLMPLTDIANEISLSKKFGGEINIDYKGIPAHGSYLASIEEPFKAKILLNARLTEFLDRKFQKNSTQFQKRRKF